MPSCCHRTAFALLVVAASIAVPVAAQAARADVQVPTFARVVDGHGAAIADAVVTFVGGFPHRARELQQPDVLQVATDKRGRAVARLQPDRCYVAWAVAPIGADGQRMESLPHGFFAAGALFELSCKEPDLQRTCTLVGEEPWRHVGPLHYYVLTSTPGTELCLERGANGTIGLPGGPFDTFEVRTADGHSLWHAPVAARLTMPPPRSVRVRAVDAAGRPLVGAEVLHRVGRLPGWQFDGLRGVGEDRMRVLGKTDDEGRCTVEVLHAGDPLRAGRDNLLLFVAAADRPAVAGGVWSGVIYVSDRKVDEVEGDELRFECRAVEPLVGSVPLAPPGTVAQLVAVCKLFLPRDSYTCDARVFTAMVRPDGTFAFADVPAELQSSRLSFVPPMASSWQPPVFAPEAGRELPFEVARRPVGAPLPGPVGTVHLAVVDGNGGPARGAIGFVAAGDRQGVLLRDSLIRVPLDSSGGADLRLVPGRWVIVVVTADGFGVRDFEVDGADLEVDVTLRPLARTTVTLRDAAGEPVAGASLRSRGTTTRGTSDAVHSILQGLRSIGRVHWDRLRTDADGRIEIPFLPVEGVQQRLELRWDGQASHEFRLEPDAEIEVRENR